MISLTKLYTTKRTTLLQSAYRNFSSNQSSSNSQSENKATLNPFQRSAEQKLQGKSQQKKEPKIEVKSNQQVKIELKRLMTRFKLSVIPFMKTLDSAFFLRVAFFGLIVYGVSTMMKYSNEGKVYIKEEQGNSANKFSKTFGQEVKLNKIMEDIKEEDKVKGDLQKLELAK